MSETTGPDATPSTTPAACPLAGRVALVTGATRGIGRETVARLAALGAVVLLGARDAARGAAADEIRASLPQGALDAGADVRAVVLDVTDDDVVAQAAHAVTADPGRLDILVNNVNNAGIPIAGVGRRTPSTTDLADMRAVLETNVLAVVRVTNAFVPLLRATAHGRIVNVSSEVGSMTLATSPDSPLGALPGSARYPASKAAVNMLTVQYAKELRADGILVNAAYPGFTDTDFTNHRGIRTVAQGATPSIHLATLPDDGPSGILYGHVWTTTGDGDGGYGPLPW